MITHQPSHPTSCFRHPFRLLAVLVCAGATFYAAAETGTVPYTELSRRTSVDPTGREVIAIRVRPPATAPVVAAPAPVPASISTWAEKQEALRLAAKRHDSFSVTATVRDVPGLPVVSELRWRAADKDWLVYSNVDFRHLSQLGQIETADTVYAWFPFIYEADPESFATPPGLTFVGPEAEYMVYAARADWQSAPEAFAALDELHSIYERRRTELSAAHAARELEAARVAALPPEPPRPVIIRYHVPVLPPPPLEPTSSTEGGAR